MIRPGSGLGVLNTPRLIRAKTNPEEVTGCIVIVFCNDAGEQTGQLGDSSEDVCDNEKVLEYQDGLGAWQEYDPTTKKYYPDGINLWDEDVEEFEDLYDTSRDLIYVFSVRRKYYEIDGNGSYYGEDYIKPTERSIPDGITVTQLLADGDFDWGSTSVFDFDDDIKPVIEDDITEKAEQLGAFYLCSDFSASNAITNTVGGHDTNRSSVLRSVYSDLVDWLRSTLPDAPLAHWEGPVYISHTDANNGHGWPIHEEGKPIDWDDERWLYHVNACLSYHHDSVQWIDRYELRLKEDEQV